MAAIQPGAIGHPALRIDGRSKVTGSARYPSDEPVANVAHAFLVTSAIAKGRVAGMDLSAARGVPGVLDILTHENVGDQSKPPPPSGGKGQPTTTMETDQIWHDGQIIAVVVADAYEAAREAAHKIGVRYAAETPSASFDSPGAELVPVASIDKKHEDARLGDVEPAFNAADVKIDARYETPIQHHNPLELFTTV